MGHAVGVFISATVKSGTNALHGAGYWQFQQFRWNATPDFTRLNYQAGLANGSIAPGTPEQASGRVSQPGFGVGGPVWIPKIIHGKNKLFFYIAYSKLTSIAPPNSTPIYTVPTVPERTGDFSALLVGTTNPSQYIVYDPRTAALVSGHVTRTPFPNNIVPASMQTNPVAKFCPAHLGCWLQTAAAGVAVAAESALRSEPGCHAGRHAEYRPECHQVPGAA